MNQTDDRPHGLSVPSVKTAIDMPDKDNNILTFNNFHKQQAVHLSSIVILKVLLKKSLEVYLKILNHIQRLITIFLQRC